MDDWGRISDTPTNSTWSSNYMILKEFYDATNGDNWTFNRNVRCCWWCNVDTKVSWSLCECTLL